MPWASALTWRASASHALPWRASASHALPWRASNLHVSPHGPGPPSCPLVRPQGHLPPGLFVLESVWNPHLKEGGSVMVFSWCAQDGHQRTLYNFRHMASIVFSPVYCLSPPILSPHCFSCSTFVSLVTLLVCLPIYFSRCLLSFADPLFYVVCALSACTAVLCQPVFPLVWSLFICFILLLTERPFFPQLESSPHLFSCTVTDGGSDKDGKDAF